MNYGSSYILCLTAFWCALFFQISQTYLLFNLSFLSPIVSLFILVSMIPYFFWRRPYTLKVFIFYLCPIFLILFGVLINFVKNVITSGSLSTNIAVIFPYFYALTFAYYIGCHKDILDKIFDLYVTAMTILSALAIIDVCAIFFGIYDVSSYAGSTEQYAKGAFAFYGMLDNGIIYPRMYGVFPEPGHLAMYLFPVLAFHFIKRNVLFFLINLVCFIATLSLGGYIGFLLAGLLMFFYSVSQKFRLVHIFSLIVGISLIYISYDFLSDYYVSKGDSASIREGNFLYFFYNFKDMVVTYPLGYPFFESLEQAIIDERYVTSTNFTPFNIYLQGGLISMISYCYILAVAFYFVIKNHRKKDLYIRIFCITTPIFILFTVQRTTPFESSYFPFLLAPFIIHFLFNPKNV